MLGITNLHNSMILSTLSISSRGCTLGFLKRSYSNGDLFFIYKLIINPLISRCGTPHQQSSQALPKHISNSRTHLRNSRMQLHSNAQTFQLSTSQYECCHGHFIGVNPSSSIFLIQKKCLIRTMVFRTTTNHRNPNHIVSMTHFLKQNLRRVQIPTGSIHI